MIASESNLRSDWSESEIPRLSGLVWEARGFHPFSSPHPDHPGFLSPSQHLSSDRLCDGRWIAQVIAGVRNGTNSTFGDKF